MPSLSALSLKSILSLLLLQILHTTSATPLRQRRDLLGDITAIVNVSDAYTIPQNSDDKAARAAAIKVTQAGFLYGPPVAGGPYFPSGALGIARAAADQADIQLDLVPELALAALDDTKATVDILKVLPFPFGSPKNRS
jgi:hypothetical protein